MKIFDSTRKTNKWLLVTALIFCMVSLVCLTYQISKDYAYNKTISEYLDAKGK